MRSQWTRDELDGAFLVWLVEVHFPGQVVRYATHTIDVVDGANSYHYPGTSEPMVYSEKADLFDKTPSTSEMGIAGIVDIDLPAMYATGHRFSFLFAEVSQVRVVDGPGGLDVLDEYTDRRVLIAGRTRTPQWGRVNDDGHTWFAADIVTEWFARNRTIPASGEVINETTWPNMARASTDEGVCYPVPIGYPGLDTASDIPVPAAPIAWIKRGRRINPVVAAGLGILDATSIKMVHASDPAGVTVNLSTDYTPYGGTAIPAVSATGTQLTVVDYVAEGYDAGGGSPLYDYYLVDTDDATTACVSFPSGQGGILWRGELLRGAGQVLAWALEQSGYRVDYGTLAAAAPYLDRFKIDTILSAQVDAAEWIQTSLLPILPVSLVSGPDGIRVYAWRGMDVGPEDCTVLDADADPRIEVSDTVFADESDTANLFTIRYGWGAISKETRYTLRIGPGTGGPESDDYASTLFDNTGTQYTLTAPTSRVRVVARTKGFDGAGITVDVAYAGGATSATDSGRTVTIRIQNTGVDDARAIAAVINAGSALVRATSEKVDDDPAIWSGAQVSPSPAISRTFLLDYGTIPDPRCEASRRARARESESGVVEAPEIEVPIVMDHTTARAILEWNAALRASPRTTLSMEGPEETMTNLRPLDPVLVTYAAHGLTERIGWAEEVEHHSDGRVAVRVVCLDE